MPDLAELNVAPEELVDPIGDNAHRPVAGTVIAIPTACCPPDAFLPCLLPLLLRREFVGPGGTKQLDGAALDAALGYIAANEAIWEVILTGGDPLSLSPDRLRATMQRLGDIAHVKIVRAHTRVFAAWPARIDAAMVAALKASGKAVFVALHANHPRELTPQARAACARLIDAGVAMVSQSVLLRGVNDEPRRWRR